MAGSALNSDALLADRLTQFNRAANGADDPALVLPAGPCTFRELAQGRDAQSCGCNAFWLNDSLPQGQGIRSSQQSLSKRATCCCGHHACYHAYEKVDAASAGNNFLTAQTPLEFHGSAVFKTPSQNYTSRRGLDAQNSMRGHNSFAGQQSGVAYQQIPQDLAELLDHGYVPDPQFDNHGLGLFSRDPASRAYAAQLQLPPNGSYNLNDVPNLYSQFRVPPSPQTAGQPQSGNVVAPNPLPPPIEVPSLPDTAPDELSGSATEVATPSVTGDLAAGFQPSHFDCPPEVFTQAMAAVNRTFISQSDARSTVSRSSRQPAQATPNAITLPNFNQQVNAAEWYQKILAELAPLKEEVLKNTELRQSVQQLHQRIERLETASFSHATDQDVADKLESLDVRLIEIGCRMEELEAFREFFNNKDSVSFDSGSSRHRFGSSKSQNRGNISRDTRESESGSTSKASIMNQLKGVLQRIDSLEAAASSSTEKPWEVEVVLLPWNPDLSGIWFNGRDASQASFPLHERVAASNSAVTPYTGGQHSTLTTQEWSGAASTRLSPRACGPTEGSSGTIYSRLKSRGFVQRLVFEARDASSIHATISNAFAKHLQSLNEPFASALTVSQQQRTPIGLQGDFVPLRKVHESSRLRYLSAGELAAPSCWTADFLDSSVFMKAAGGLRRLYITQPAAYFQHTLLDTTTPSLASWQAIRELPRFKSGTSAESSFVGEGDAREKCWSFNQRLDPSGSAHSSFSSAKDSIHTTSEPLSPEYSMADVGVNEDMSSEDESSGQSNLPSVTGVSRPGIHPITPITEFSASQARRSVSLPITQDLVPVQIYNAPKRNATSFNAANPAAREAVNDQHLKRRRQSPSSGEETARRASQKAFQNPTPRHSREPPSPESNTMQDPRWNREDVGSVIPRGPTPIPYATPYSNNNIGSDWMMQRDEAGNGVAEEDAWHGVSESEHDMEYSEEDDDDDDDDIEDASDSEMSEEDDVNENEQMVDDYDGEEDEEDDDDDDDDELGDID